MLIGTLVLVVSLPMRDGNLLRDIHACMQVHVVSLPMRDGNGYSFATFRKAVSLLAYL